MFALLVTLCAWLLAYQKVACSLQMEIYDLAALAIFKDMHESANDMEQARNASMQPTANLRLPAFAPCGTISHAKFRRSCSLKRAS